MIPHKWSVALGLYVASFCLNAQHLATDNAQEEESKATSTQQDQSIRTHNLNAISVTATRQEQHVLDVPATVNVISREEMDRRIVNNIEDLVRYQPGIQVNRTTSGTDPYGNLQGFSIRGMGGNRIQMQVDGARVIETGLDGNRNFVDLSLMRGVEIVRGPGSVLWGADALGGIVSYKTFDPEDILRGRQWGGRLSAGYDNLDENYTYTGIAAGQFSPALQALVGYTYRTYGDPEFSNARADGGSWGCSRVAIGCNRLNPLDGKTNNLLAKFVLSPNADHKITLTGEDFKSDIDADQLWDRYITYQDYQRNQVQKRQRLALEHEWAINSLWIDDLKWRLSYSPQERSLTDHYITTANRNNQIIRKTDYSEDFLQADIQLTSSFKLGSSQHVITYGFQGDTTETKYDRATTTTVLATGNSTTTYGGSGFADSDTTRADLFIQDEMKFINDRLTIVPGLRWANYTIDPKQNRSFTLIPGREPRKLSSHEIIPQLGATYQLTNNHSVYARYAEGFKMPTAVQLFSSYTMGTSNVIPNPDLEPEEVKSYELGFRTQTDKAWASIGAFYNDYTNFIKTRQQIPGTIDYTSKNVSKVKLWGVEASIGWEFTKNWHLNAAASYQHGKEKGQDSNEYIPFSDALPLNGTTGIKWVRADHKLDVELMGTFFKGYTRVNQDNYFKPAGYAIYDSYLNWEFAKDIRLTLAVKNMFDRRYFTPGASTQTAIPGSAAVARTTPLELYTGYGRTLAINLSADF